MQPMLCKARVEKKTGKSFFVAVFEKKTKEMTRLPKKKEIMNIGMNTEQ